MSAKRISWIVTALIVLLMTGCGTTDTKNQLKPPSVYRNPQVQITHAPTEIASDPSNIEVSETATADVTDPLYAEPTIDEEQAMMDDIESSLNELEGKLERMNTNP